MAKKKRKINIYYLLAFLLVIGVVVLNGINALNQSRVIRSYQEDRTREELAAEKQISMDYNKSLEWGTALDVRDVFTEDEVNSISLFNSDKPLGYVEVPQLGISLPIYEGTSEKELQVGAGHMEGTSFPTGEINTHSVITAHRGLTTKRMFRDLDKLEVGGIFFIDTYGEKKAYEVYDKQVVEPSDASSIQIVEGEEIVTLLTCEPYMINSHRLLVNGKRVEYMEEEDKVIDSQGQEKKVVKRGFLDFFRDLSFKDLVDVEYLIIIGVVFLFILRRAYKVFKKRRKAKR